MVVALSLYAVKPNFLERKKVMNERRITEIIAFIFDFATNREEIIDLSDFIKDIVEQEKSNRLFDLGLLERKMT